MGRNIILLILIISLCLLFSTKTKAQIIECGVIDNVNNLFLQKQRVSLSNKNINYKNTNLSIPIWIHIVTQNNGLGGVDTTLVKEAIELTNIHFSGTGIQFIICNTEFIHNSDYYYLLDKTEGNKLSADYNRSNSLNIYFVKDASGSCGWARFPWANTDYVVIDNDCIDNQSTISHELGHYFGLLHTHSTSNGKELVDGSNCLSAGDLICDTPADPNISGLVDDQCNYMGTEKDANGDPYSPSTNNFMSYSKKGCLNYFTDDQINIMKYYALNERDYLLCNLNGTLPDIFVKNIEAPSFALQGEEIELKCRHRYSGGGTNVNTKVGYFLSVDDQWDASDTFLGDDLSGISALDTYDGESELITIPTVTSNGNYFLLYVADYQNSVIETHEDNNIKVQPIQIGNTVSIDVSQFSATAINGLVQLDWETSSETNIDVFEILRSENGQNWEMLEELESAGNSLHPIHYKFLDVNPFIGTNYYRLKQIDFSGSSSYSDIRSVEFNSVDWTVKIYPSVFTDYVNIVSFTKIAHIDIYDMGRMRLHSQKFIDHPIPLVDHPILLAQLVPGMYVLKIVLENGSTQSIPLVKINP